MNIEEQGFIQAGFSSEDYALFTDLQNALDERIQGVAGQHLQPNQLDAAIKLNGSLKKIIQRKSSDPENPVTEQVLRLLMRDKATLANLVQDFLFGTPLIQERLRERKEVILEAVQRYPLALQMASPVLRRDKEVVLAAVRQNGSALEYASSEIQGDKEVVLVAVRQQGLALWHASSALQGDKEIVLAAVRQHGLALRYASSALQGDKEIVLAAVRQHGPALRYASSEMQGDKEFILEVVRQNSSALKCVSPAMQGNKEVVLEAVQQNGLALEHASPTMQGDKEVVLAAVRQNGLALEHASSAMRRDKEVALAAVWQNGLALDYASLRLLGDKELALEAVRQNGLALEIVSPSLRMDKEVVLAAVRQNGSALKYTSSAMQEDKEFILEAVRQNTLVLWYISPSLRGDKEFILEAVRQVPQVLGSALEILRIDSLPSTKLPQAFQKIRNSEILTAFGQLVALYATDVERIFEKYPESWYLQILALCLTPRFPNDFETIQAIIEPLTKSEGPLRGGFRNMQTGLLQSLAELLLFQHPPISPEEIRALFENLPKSMYEERGKKGEIRQEKIDPEKFKQQIFYIRTFLSLGRGEERTSLVERLHQHFEEQINGFQESVRSFIASYGVRDISEAILESPRLGALVTYLLKQRDNVELAPSIHKLLEGISLGRVSQERYLASHSAHMQTLASDHRALWESWKALTFSSEEVENAREAAFSFRGFLDDKVQNGHLPQEITQALRGESQGEESEGFKECYSYLQTRLGKDEKPEKVQVEKGIRLFSQHYPRCEFINDLSSLLPQQSGKEKKIELSDQWEDLLVCGTDVLGSCQRVDGNPQLNKCLLAYILDGKNRLLCVKGSQKKIVSRVILRLLLKEDNAPALFIERCYGDQAYAEPLRQSANEISKRLGIELYETVRSYQEERVNLRSLGTSVPYEYCDAAHGVTNGKFSHPGALVDG